MKLNRLDRISARALCFALSLFLWSAAQGQPKPADAPATAAAATTASQETPAAGKTPPGDKPAASPADKPPSAPEAATPNPADADKVALNLRGANIDQVLSFLSELAGMPVMKQKDAKAQITIVNKDKVAKQDAIRMICEALRLDGTAVVMRDHIVWLVPESQVSSLDIGLTLDTGKLPQVGIVTRAIPVKFADVAELEKIIRPLLGKNATLIADAATRQLIITDAADRILNVQRVLAQLDALDVDNRQLQIFQLHYADAEEIAPILRTIMAPPPRANAGPSQPSPAQPNPGQPNPGQPGGASAAKPVNDVEVQSYKAANWLVVVAPKEKLAKIAQLVAEMDQELTQEVKLRTITVKFASAQDLARQLGDLVRKRYDKKVREVIEVGFDERSNTIVILSSEQNFKAIQKIVTQLDTEESLETKTEWFELKHADAEDMAQQMNDLYEGMQQNNMPWWWGGSSRKATTRFVCEKRSNSLIAIAPPAEMERIRKLVERLDQVIDAAQCAPRLYPIHHTDAKELADVLNKVFGVQDAKTVTHGYWENVKEVGGNKVGRLNGKVRFDPLITGNAIIVTTSNKENFPIIESFLRQMDAALPESSNLLVMVLKNAQATDVADQLNILFGREGTRIPPKTQTTTPAQGQQSQQGQQQSQPQADQSQQGWILTAPPTLKDARPISDLIGRVRVVADVRTNALLITTQAENRDAVRQLVEELDKPSPKVYVSVRLIEVSRTNASHVGVRFSSTPSLFSSTDFDNGLQTNLGITWQAAFHNGLLTSTALTPAVLAQYILEHFDSRILSDTSLTMDNNRQGQIFVGSQIPTLLNSQVSNGVQSQGYNYTNVGTNLTMTPIINTENRVVMNINMQASQLEPGVTILGGSVIDTRTFTTILAVENNQTIVMGGIMSEQYVENVRRFPILGYIPVLDWIFAKKDKQRVVTEIIAFITPVVLRGPADAADMTHKTEEDIKRRQEWPVLPPEKGEVPDDKGIGGEMK
jgi:type II secretory pathway component GspD/PulD (secretin)